MTTVTPTEIVYLRTGTVRLLERHGDVGPGSLGYLIGKFARENPTYLVSFDTAVVEVREDEITASAA
jgi:hypothetical protein